MTRSRILPALLIAATLLIAAPALAGCANPVQQAIDDATGDEGQLPGMTVPADFPAEVPLVDGDVKLGTKATDESWMVTMVVRDGSGLEDADRLLEEAGFTEMSAESHTWKNDDYTVIISSAQTDAGFALSYIVAAA
jgi:hypothetical protein